MTTFQPGDVVRLTGYEWDKYPGHPRWGSTHTIDSINDEGPVFHWNEERWLIYQGYEAELADGPLSPQAVLDAICGVSFSIGDATWREYRIEGYADDLNLTARKVDGHWQVKSVGGGE